MHMKKVLLCFAFAAQGWLLSAQIFVDGVKIGPDNTGHYIELDPMYKSDGRCSFSVDFGQADPKEDFTTDEHGKRVDFRSLVDGLDSLRADPILPVAGRPITITLPKDPMTNV